MGDRYPCPCCGETGCDECDGFGRVVITEPPHLSNGVWETLTYSQWMEKGMCPVAGGMLDQTKWFTDAALFVLSEWERLKAEAVKG